LPSELGTTTVEYSGRHVLARTSSPPLSYCLNWRSRLKSRTFVDSIKAGNGTPLHALA